MDNPYQVLGLDKSATDEQIKEAYRSLAKQYSSSDYTADPLADVADSRMQRLNEAYDQIMAERRVGADSPYSGAGSASGSSQYTGGSAYQQSATQNYQEVRQMLRSGDVNSAEQRLTAVDSSLRGAEWNYLMGCVCQRRGWLDQSYRYFANANAIEPSNSEY
ncbi:MAG: J domain-containing protein, partial [Oscillospiraceae bacterium]|nr:J domain-containing protein [Oscillospiraceae bacterium]